MQIILTRDHISVPWGFRLKGGAEYNVPLSILKVCVFLYFFHSSISGYIYLKYKCR